MALQHGFKARANRIALQIRAEMNLVPTDPLDPWAVCGRFDIAVCKLSKIKAADGSQHGSHFLTCGKAEFSAMTVPVGATRVIVHNDIHAPARQRSNLMHELAHCFLGHPITPPLLENGERDRDGGIEGEAAFLGGVLLIPDVAALHIVRQALPPGSAEAIYGVSSTMLTYRLRVSGAVTIAKRIATRERK